MSTDTDIRILGTRRNHCCVAAVEKPGNDKDIHTKTNIGGNKMEHTLSVSKDDVYNEVAKTTEYTGSKMEDAEAYKRIFTTEQDKVMLERFWNESKNSIAGSLKKFLVSENEASGSYVLTLELSASFDESLLESMERSLFSFFVMNITAKWYTLANKQEATDYAAAAVTNIDDIMRKAFFKKKPQRPTYN